LVQVQELFVKLNKNKNMISFLFFFLAGFFNGFMDMVTFREDRSILDKYNLSPFQTYDPKKKFLGIVQFDFWHNIKYLMVLSFTLVGYFGGPVFGLWDILIYFCLWWAGFELSWKILTKKK
jgi:hypothetical protein